MPIKPLTAPVIAAISAGEVIERPASVVKELIENALDAGATRIRIDVDGGGLRSIRVSDNGTGIPADQAVMAFSRHATSKLSSLKDLENIGSLGFRGEALAAVAAAADVEMATRARDSMEGVLVFGKAGAKLESRPVGCETGTTITASNLFKKMPARLKFMRSPAAEAAAAVRIVEPYALMNLSVHFVVSVNGEEKINAPATDDLHARIREIAGDPADQMKAFSAEKEGVAVHGYAQLPGTVSGRGRHWILVNSRPVEDKAVRHALISSYRGQLPRDSFPSAVIFIQVPAGRLDVNVHPAKSEVRFADQQSVYRTVAGALIAAFAETSGAPDSGPSEGSEAARTQAGEQASIPGLNPAAGFPAKVREGGVFWRPLADPVRGEIEILAQLFETYIVARDARGLLLIDQHAAHEKIVYERLLRSRTGGKIASQALLVPQTMEVSAGEAMVLKAGADIIEELGIQFDEFGGNSIVIRAVPEHAAESEVAAMLRSLIQDLQLAGQAPDRKAAMRKLLATVACHMALKAARRLTPGEMEAVARELFDLEDPLSCPHGRPTFTRFSENDLARLFKRT